MGAPLHAGLLLTALGQRAVVLLDLAAIGVGDVFMRREAQVGRAGIEAVRQLQLHLAQAIENRGAQALQLRRVAGEAAGIELTYSNARSS